MAPTISSDYNIELNTDFYIHSEYSNSDNKNSDNEISDKTNIGNTSDRNGL
jgi:hypothetical protein